MPLIQGVEGWHSGDKDEEAVRRSTRDLGPITGVRRDGMVEEERRCQQ